MEWLGRHPAFEILLPGLGVDAGQTVRPWPLEQVKVPTLVLSAVRAGIADFLRRHAQPAGKAA